jgi:hypothetical protein
MPDKTYEEIAKEIINMGTPYIMDGNGRETLKRHISEALEAADRAGAETGSALAVRAHDWGYALVIPSKRVSPLSADGGESHPLRIVGSGGDSGSESPLAVRPQSCRPPPPA